MTIHRAHFKIRKLLLKTSLFFVLLLPQILYSQNCELKGSLINSDGEHIPFATVYLPDLGKSGMANENGEFTITGSCKTHKVQFQSLGYQSKTIKLNFSEKKNHQIKLKQVAYQLREVTIDPNKEDPAYNIIRKATVMAEFYKKQINAYRAKLYVRSYFNINEMPWLVEKMAPEDELEVMKSGDVVETVVEYSFKKPDIIKEKIIAKKSAKPDSMMMGSNYINLNFYNLGGSSIVNPLSRGAFHLYNFEYQHSYYQGNQKVHKIKIIPKRRGDDLMRGDIYINDGSWNINQVDVSFTQQMVELNYNQIYQKIHDIVWMPVNHKIKAKINFMGVDMDVQYLATLKNIEVETDSIIDKKILRNINKRTESPNDSIAAPTITPTNKPKTKRQKKIHSLLQKKELSNRETFKLLRLVKKEQKELEKDTVVDYELNNNHSVKTADSVLADNDSIWQSDRSIPLSEKEKNIYKKNDTLDFSILTNPDTTHEQSTFSKILFYNRQVSGDNKKTSWKLRGIFSGVLPTFNTVDGWKLRKKITTFSWENHKSRYLEITPTVSYAFARNRWMTALNFNSQYNKKYQGRIYGSFGRKSSDFNSEPNFPALTNSLSSLVFSSNYKKLYEEDYIRLGHKIEPINGLKLDVEVTYSERKILSNHSSQKWFDFMDKAYTENLPKHPERQFKRNIYNNSNFKFKASIRYTPKLYYRYFHYDKKTVNSKYATFGLDFEQGIPGVFNSDGDYQRLEISIRQKRSYRLIDAIQYHFAIGKFLKNDRLSFMDYKSFTTAPFYLMTTSPSFKIMDYYGFNSNAGYFEGHFSVEDNHILLKYLPLLNRTNWNEKLYFNYLYTTDRETHYSEVGYSLNRLFLFMNAGIFVNFKEDEYHSVNFRIGIDFNEFID